MPNALDGAISRIRRASRHINEAESLIDLFASECEDRLIESNRTNTPFHFPAIPEDLALAISDTIHNLRAPLDYPVYELAFKDSGSIQEGTQFPLEHCRTGRSPHGSEIGFDSVVGRYLKGIKPEHVAIVERFQPYNGHDWARNLRDLSNPDKHRRLTLFHRTDSINTWVSGPHADGKKLPSGDTLKADPTHTIFIKLPDRNLWVLHTLLEIQAGVMDTLNAFGSAF